MELSFGDVALRLLVAAVLGAGIGMERELRGHPAGFRTLMVLAVASALIMLLSLRVGTSEYATAAVRSDPGRIAAQAVSGIGFLGAGAILRMGLTVHGLTTAAVMWAVAGLGLACGAGFYQEALLAGLIIGLALLILPPLESTLLRSAKRTVLHLTATRRPDLVEDISIALRRQGLKVEQLIVMEQSEARLEIQVMMARTSAAGSVDPKAVLLGVKGVEDVTTEGK